MRLAELVASLALATDLGSGQPMERSFRRCVLAVRMGKAAGASNKQLASTYYAALLQYIGCTTEAHEIAAVWGDEIATGGWFAEIATAQPAEAILAILRLHGAGEPVLRRVRMLATALTRMPRQSAIMEAHCEVGMWLAERLGLGPDVQEALAQVYERWDGKGMPARLPGDAIATPVRILKLAQDAEIFHAQGGVETAIAVAQARSGHAHDPDLVGVLAREAADLFDGLSAVSWGDVLAAEPGDPRVLSDQELAPALEAVADFADLKSPFLAGHSRAVAELVGEAARAAGLPASDVESVRRAGLLHDLGRVGVSAGIWGKEAQLTESEWERVRLHPYFTERVLARSPGLAALGSLAGAHHERLDGCGYHRGAAASELPAAARLLAAADVYEALREDRPHRPARVPDAAAAELRAEVRAGKLDGEAVEAVLAAAGHPSKKRRVSWPAGLSGREVEVLRLVARGLSNRQMGAQLHLSPRTVHHHVQHIYDKLGVSTRAAATLFAMQHGLLTHTSEIPQK